MIERNSLKIRLEKIQTENRSLRQKLTLFKEEDRSLKRQLADAHNLFNSIPTGLILLQKGMIVDANQTALDQLGYLYHEIIGSDFMNLVPPHLKSTVKKRHNRRRSTNAVPEPFEYDLIAKNGTIIGFDCSLSKLKSNGRVALLLNMSLRAERKQRESEAIHSGKKEAILTMASGMTHYLIQALEEITRNAKQMTVMEGSGNEALTQCINNIDRAARDITIIHSKLERLSEVRPKESKKRSFDLREAVKLAVTEASPMVKELGKKGTKIDIKTYLRPVSPVIGDVQEIKAAMINVIINAVEAMPEGGSLYITTEENAGRSFTYFQDNGIGIDEHVKGRMIDPFFTTKEEGNVGLGLSLSHAIIKRHGGALEITGEKESGSTVTMMLPVSSRQPDSVPTRSKRHVKDAKILIIERDDVIRELLSQVLTGKGYYIVTVDNPIEGLKKIKKQGYSMLIADLKTSHRDDLFILKKFKEVNPSLPIALILENSDAVNKPLNTPDRYELILRKPLDINRLVNQIPTLLMQHHRSR